MKMTTRLSRLVPVLAASLVLLACQAGYGEPEETMKLEGSLFYYERIALPEGSKVRVWLEDSTEEPIAETEFTTDRQVPLPFKLEFAPGRLPESGEVILHAQIDFADDGPRYSTRHEFQLDPEGHQPDLNLRVSEGGR